MFITVNDILIFCFLELAQSSHKSNEDQMAVIISKVRDLGRQFTINSPCFPVGMYYVQVFCWWNVWLLKINNLFVSVTAYLVMQLEVLSCELEVVKSHVHKLMVDLGVSVLTLLDIYDQ